MDAEVRSFERQTNHLKRVFIGEVGYRGEILPGEQPAIIDKNWFRRK